MQVYKAQWRVQTVAVKMLSNTTAKQMEAFQREALILEDLKDTNIVQVIFGSNIFQLILDPK